MKNGIIIIFLLCVAACSPTYTLDISKVKDPLPKEQTILRSYGEQVIHGKEDVLGTLAVESRDAGSCDPKTIFDKSNELVRQAGGNSFKVTSIDIKLTANFVPCTNFKGEILHVEYSDLEIISTAEELKEGWNDSFNTLEGIYEGVDPNGYSLQLALKRNQQGQYQLIYLSGVEGDFNTVWKEGQLKARLIDSSTNQFFKLNWININRTLSSEFIVSFSPGVMTLMNPKAGFSQPFLQTYPTESGLTLSSGSGFAVSAEGYIVTNHHVIAGASSILVKGVEGDFSKEYPAEVVVSDERNDLAIIKISTDETPISPIPFRIKPKTSEVGSEIFVLGYPLRATMGDELKLTNGLISSKTGYQGDITSYQVSAPVQPGNSGGPTFDLDGNIVGVINAKHFGAENVTYSVKANYLQNLFELLPVDIELNSETDMEGKTLSELVSAFRNFVYIIEVN